MGIPEAAGKTGVLGCRVVDITDSVARLGAEEKAAILEISEDYVSVY
jgi:hypothetical protein